MAAHEAERQAQADEPFELFETWFDEAGAHEPNDPNAMALWGRDYEPGWEPVA